VRHIAVVLTLTLCTVGACSSGSERKTDSAAAIDTATHDDMDTSSSATPVADTGGVSQDSHYAAHMRGTVTIGGGRFPGTYPLPMGTGDCIDLSPVHDSVTAVSHPPFSDATDRVTMIQVSTGKAARAGGSSNFYFDASVVGHDRHDTQIVTIAPAAKKGSGTITLTGKGALVTAHVKGTSAQGPTVDATFECLP
jgi:hypothetical protein